MCGTKRVCVLLAASIVGVCPLSLPAFAIPVERPLVVAYHQFVEHESGLERNMPVMLISQFEDQLRYLRENGIRALSIEEYVDAISSPTPPEKTVLLTIDDGYESVCTLVYPLLRKYDMHATAFVIASRIGKQNVTNPHQPWLSWEECREMQASGLVDIEAHADGPGHDKIRGVRDGRDANGPYLTTRMVDPDTGEEETDVAYGARVLNELAAAKRKIDTNLGKSTVAFCWPFGASTAKTLVAAREAGYQVTFRLAGDSHIDGDRLRLHSPENWVEITRVLGGAGPRADISNVVAAPSGYDAPAGTEATDAPSIATTSPREARRSARLQGFLRRLVLAGVAVTVSGLFWGLCALVWFRAPRPNREYTAAPAIDEPKEGPSGPGA